MEIICFICNGSGWKTNYPFGLNTPKPVFVYIPCDECKGKGFIIPPEPKEKENGI